MIEDIRNLKELHKEMIEKIDALEKLGTNFKDESTIVLVLQHTINLFNESQNYYNEFFKKHEVLINKIYGQPQQEIQKPKNENIEYEEEDPHFEGDNKKTNKEVSREVKQKELNKEHEQKLKSLETENDVQIIKRQEERDDALENKLNQMKKSFKNDDDDYYAKE